MQLSTANGGDRVKSESEQVKLPKTFLRFKRSVGGGRPTWRLGLLLGSGGRTSNYHARQQHTGSASSDDICSGNSRVGDFSGRGEFVVGDKETG